MSAFKPVSIFVPRQNVIAKFRPQDGPNLPKQVVLFSTLSEFREYARRISATTAGKLDYAIAEFAVDNEHPKPSYNSKQIRFHNALRADLLKRRESFIKNKQSKPAPLSLGKAKTLFEAEEGYFKYASVEVSNPKTLATYANSQRRALELQITHDSGFTKKLGDYRFDELEFGFDGTGFKIIAGLVQQNQAGKLADNSLYLTQQQIKRYFKYLQLKGWTTNIPLYPKVAQPEPHSVPFEDDELERFEEYAKHLYEHGDESQVNILRGFYLARFTGARVHEIAALKVKHWQRDSATNSHFKLPKAKGKKAGKKGETVSVLLASNDILIDFLDKDFANRDPEEYVLGKSGNRPWYSWTSQYTYTFSQVLKKLGIVGKQPWHAFRHTGAIELYEITGDIEQVRAFLRHKLIETTKRYLNLNRVNHVVEKSQNFIGKKFVKTARSAPVQETVQINNTKLLEAA